jgi:hypothetical protein
MENLLKYQPVPISHIYLNTYKTVNTHLTVRKYCRLPSRLTNYKTVALESDINSVRCDVLYNETL